MSWSGDWNRVVPTVEKRLGETDLWMCTGQFPLDARLEYQMVLDGDQQVLDPLNPLSEVGGLATKSVLRMPDYVEPAFTEFHEGVPQGKLTENLTLSSASLGYDVHYRVYTPEGYAQLSRLPALYVTDGQDLPAIRAHAGHPRQPDRREKDQAAGRGLHRSARHENRR